MSASPEPPVRSAVLALSAHVAEWVERGPAGEFRYGRVPVEGTGHGDLVRAAAGAKEAAGGRQRVCVLALGEGLLGLRPLTLPPLARAEARRVLVRKTAALLSCDPQDALFTTLAMGGREPDEPGEALLLVGMRRGPLTALRLALRRRGFQVLRVTSAALAPIERARLELDHPEAPVMLVNVGPRSSWVTLVAGDQLLNHDVLEGDLLEVPALAASLLQTVRTCAGYWRKVHRGERVEAVAVLGLPRERGALLGQSIEAALPGTRVSVLSGDDGGDGDQLTCRAEALTACLWQGPLAPDLTTHIPTRRPLTAVLLTVLLGLVLALSGLAYRHAGSTIAVVQAEAARLEAESRELAALERVNREALRELEVLRSKVERAKAIARTGIDYEGLLRELLLACSGRAELLGVEVSRDFEGQRTVELRARTSADAVRSTFALRAIEEELRGGRHLRDVSVDLPSGVSSGPGAGGRAGALEFLVQARLEAWR